MWNYLLSVLDYPFCYCFVCLLVSWRVEGTTLVWVAVYITVRFSLLLFVLDLGSQLIAKGVFSALINLLSFLLDISSAFSSYADKIQLQCSRCLVLDTFLVELLVKHHRFFLNYFQSSSLSVSRQAAWHLYLPSLLKWSSMPVLVMLSFPFYSE